MPEMTPDPAAPAPIGHAAALGGVATALLAAVLVFGELATLDAALTWLTAAQLHLSRTLTVGVAAVGGVASLWATAIFLRRAVAAERALASGRYGASALLDPVADPREP